MEDQNTNFDVLDLLDKENDLKRVLGVDRDSEIWNKDLDKSSDFGATISEEKSETKKALEKDLENHDIDPLDNVIRELEVEKASNKKALLGKIIDSVVFLFKYLVTSTLVFVVLLVSTNYSAYIEIAKSYLNPEALEKSKLDLLSSINGVSISVESNSEKESDSQSEIVLENSVKKEAMWEKMNSVKNKTYHSMDKLLASGYESKLDIEIVPYENRIVIPKIGKNVPLIEIKNRTVKDIKELENVFMSELSKGVVRYPGSAKPGEIGNSFIFGHSSNFPWVKGDYNDVFALLDNIVFGDEIIVYYNQKKFVYRVKEKKVIKPGDVSILKRNKKVAEITLMTCWPIGTTINRMVVVGELVK